MDCQTFINLLDITPNQTLKYKERNCVETNHDARERYNTTMG